MHDTERVARYYEELVGSRYETKLTWYDETEVYKWLSSALIDKKICKCTYITSIKRRQLYNGFIEITIKYDHGGRDIIIVKG